MKKMKLLIKKWNLNGLNLIFPKNSIVSITAGATQ